MRVQSAARMWAIVGLTLVILPAAWAQAPVAKPGDWPHWRGPQQNGISTERDLPESFDPEDAEGGNLLWKNAELGTISTPIVMDGRLYTLLRRDPDSPTECEAVVCADAATGKILWETRFNVYLSDVPGERVAWSNVVGDPATGRIYAQGVCGYFVCLDGETGKTVWSRSLHEEFGLLSTYGGRTNSPVVFDDLVIIGGVMTNWGELARPAHRVLGMDKATGEVRWLASTRLLPEDTVYSTPTLGVVNGQAVVVFGSGDGAVYAFQPRTGKQIWKYQVSRRGLNVSPLLAEGRVYMGHSEENLDNNTMGAVMAIDGTRTGDITDTGTIWLEKTYMVGKSSPLLIDGRLYTVDDGAGLAIFDAATGELIGRKQKLGTVMRGSLAYGDGKIYGCDANGRFHILQVTEDGVKPLARTRFPAGEDVQGSPIIAHGRVYQPTTGALYCIGAKDARPKAAETPVRVDQVEAPAQAGDKPAWVQIVPAELLVKPGDQVQFHVRLFNERGQRLPEAENGATLAWSCEHGGEIDPQGRFTANSDAAHTGVVVEGKLGELSGTARVRIVPPLPWKFDFDAPEVPLSWIGARYRHQIRQLDGEPVMVKVSTIPKGTRSQAWMGPIDLHDYTIQADVRGTLNEGKLPDIGLVAQRYTLDLMGAHQQLQIRTWTSTLRAAQSVKFPWVADKWYTMKFRASVEDGNAVLRGKVWPRGEPEPKEWTITAVDKSPNLIGSPGLFGNANEAEMYYDNITVEANTAEPVARK